MAYEMDVSDVMMIQCCASSDPSILIATNGIAYNALRMLRTIYLLWICKFKLVYFARAMMI